MTRVALDARHLLRELHVVVLTHRGRSGSQRERQHVDVEDPSGDGARLVVVVSHVGGVPGTWFELDVAGVAVAAGEEFLDEDWAEDG